MIGHIVIIDGKSYEVKGVEHWAIVCPKGTEKCEHPFGLLLQSATGEQRT